MTSDVAALVRDTVLAAVEDIRATARPMVTTPELMRLWRIARCTVNGWLADGAPCVRVGRGARWDPVELREWLRVQQHDPHAGRVPNTELSPGEQIIAAYADAVLETPDGRRSVSREYLESVRAPRTATETEQERCRQTQARRSGL